MKYIFWSLIFMGHVTHALAECSDKFENIDRTCVYSYVQSKSDQFSNKFLLEMPKDLEKLLGETYFYQTSNGELGKFTVRAAQVSAMECNLYLEATTYAQGQTYVPTSTFSIKNEYNKWVTDSLSLSRTGATDFTLKRDNGKCVFVADGAKIIKYKNTRERSLLEGNVLLNYSSLFLIGLAVFLVARAVFRDEERFKTTERLEDAEEESPKNQSNDIVLKYSRPFFKRYFSPVVNGMKNKKKFRDKYKRKLASAGLTQELTPEDFFAFKLFLIIGFPIAFLALRAFLEETWPLSAVPIISIAGYFYPDIWMDGKMAKRKEQIIRAMPFVVDMLALSVEAGLDFVAAMQKVIEKAPPSPLVDEFESLIKETRVGSSRAEALRQMSWRIDTLEISSFCATLIAADSVGASIGPILKTLSGEMRQKKSAMAEKKGATAATKIIFPTIFVIMPAVGIVIMGPVIMQMIAG